MHCSPRGASADSVQFLGGRQDDNTGAGASAASNANATEMPPATDVPVDRSAMQPAAPDGDAEEDIPF